MKNNNSNSKSPLIIDLTGVVIRNMEDQNLRLICADLIVRMYGGSNKSIYTFLELIEDMYNYIRTGENNKR
jgi:hypothetical protein